MISHADIDIQKLEGAALDFMVAVVLGWSSTGDLWVRLGKERRLCGYNHPENGFVPSLTGERLNAPSMVTRQYRQDRWLSRFDPSLPHFTGKTPFEAACRAFVSGERGRLTVNIPTNVLRLAAL